MSIFDSWLQLYGKRKEYEQMGMLRAQEMMRGQRGGAEILGRPEREAVPGPLMEYGKNNEFTIQLPGVEAREGTGYAGGKLSKNQAIINMLNEGYSNQDINTLFGTKQNPTSLMQNLTAAGVNLDSQEGQKVMLEAVMKPQTQVNLGGSAGTMWTPQQIAQAGLPKDSVVTTDRYGKPQILNKEKYTQAQHASSGFAMRMNTSNDEINSIFTEFPDFDPTTMRQNVDIAVPDWMATVIRSPEGQRYEQAKENWISANLRKESGAVLGEEEIAREKAKWFPVYGESATSMAQKKRARKDAENSLKNSAGGAYQDLIDRSERDRLSDLRKKHGAK